MDAGGGAPLGEDFWGIAEAVADGGVEAADEVAGLADKGGGASGAADVFDLVVGLFCSPIADRDEVVLEVGHEVRGQGVGDEFLHGRGVCEVREEGPGGGENLAMGFLAESEFNAKAGFLFADGAGGGSDDFEVFPDLGQVVVSRTGRGTGGVSWVRVIGPDFSGEFSAAGELGSGDATCEKRGRVSGSEAVDAF